MLLSLYKVSISLNKDKELTITQKSLGHLGSIKISPKFVPWLWLYGNWAVPGFSRSTVGWWDSSMWWCIVLFSCWKSTPLYKHTTSHYFLKLQLYIVDIQFYSFRACLHQTWEALETIPFLPGDQCKYIKTHLQKITASLLKKIILSLI